MSVVAVVGGGNRAAEWAVRFLAASHNVVVDDSTLVTAVGNLWPAAERLGLFPGAGLQRLSVAQGPNDLATADFVQVVDGAPPTTSALVATEATARGCSPIHLLPLVELSEGASPALADFYRSLGMTPVDHETPADQRARLGDDIVRLANGDPNTIIAVMRALRAAGDHAAGLSAGESIARREALRYTSSATPRWKQNDVVAAPLRLYRTAVEPEWVDYNDHMTEAAYLTAAGWASDALFRYIGDDEAYRAAGHSFFTVETHLHYLREAALHEPLAMATQVLGVDNKRLHFIHSIEHGDSGDLLCTVEQMLVHVDLNAGRSAPILPDVLAALTAISAAHSTLPIPPQVGSVMRIPAGR